MAEITNVTMVETKNQDPDIIPLAVQMDGKPGGQLLRLDQRKSMTETVAEVAQEFGVTDATNYALQFDTGIYVTQNNRGELQKGMILILTDSPSKSAQDLYDTLHSQNPEEISKALKKLARAGSDITFATEFIEKKGHELLIQMVEAGTDNGKPIDHTLTSFLELMEHAILSWDIVTAKFVKRIGIAIASYVNRPVTQESQLVTLRALSILESIILNSASLYNTIANEITYNNLVQHLEGKYPGIQQNCLALMNALCLKAPDDRKKRFEDALASKEIRTNIMEKVVRSSNMGTELVHQLYVFQQLTFNLLEKRMMTRIEQNNENHSSLIIDLRNAAFGTDSGPKKPGQTNAIEYQKLGFENTSNPTLDFQEVPPGVLALESMHHFALKQDQNYTKLVFENTTRADEHECPFARTSIALTKVLCEVLKVGEAPSETGEEYHPMFFSCDKAFEEFFCQCIKLFNKTWKEMRATLEDFPKVMGVVREQIERTMKGRPNRPSSMDQFWTQLQQLNYDVILNLREKERSDKEELNSKAPPVVELREQIKPEIIELIKKQRINYLIEGTQFNKFTKTGRAKDKFWYCRLSPNMKILHHGDIGESDKPAPENLLNKVAISEDMDLVTGKDCPHINRIRGTLNLAFSLIQQQDSEVHLDFMAPNFDMWTDGLNVLLGKPMVSEQMQKDLDMLLSMEMKLRLLDTVNIHIPSEAPPIPPPPADYNFYYPTVAE
ncbi:engulfment and cell motility protein 1-like [Amphiura filiformis]|uniref:engulfment and cell motility protein 1-like n=1 Tax=Amphiura filiformis TaxID=82378 RepID=UPI003B215185